jgi:hypothetical protein
MVEPGIRPSSTSSARKWKSLKKLLADTDLTISRVAKQVGYASIYFFSRLFAAFEGISTRVYRKKRLRTHGIRLMGKVPREGKAHHLDKNHFCAVLFIFLLTIQ